MKVIGMKNVILGSIGGAVVGAAALALGYYAGTAHQPAPVAPTVAPVEMAAAPQLTSRR